MPQLKTRQTKTTNERNRTDRRARHRPTAKKATVCSRCGHRESFLTDAGGYLAKVLEDPTDDELLFEGKPVYCPSCGDVFLWREQPRRVSRAFL